MNDLVDPYVFVRAISVLLAGLWTVMGVLRILRFGRRWERRLGPLGFSKRWLRWQVTLIVARATLFDPVNLGLTCLLLGLWTLPR